MGAIRVYQKSSVVVLRQLSFRHGILLKSAEARETKDIGLYPSGRLAVRLQAFAV
jgi:hypothetical protein